MKLSEPNLPQQVEMKTISAMSEERPAKVNEPLAVLPVGPDWLNTLFQTISEGIVTFDADARISYFSPGAERITGWSSQEANNRHINQVFHLPGEQENFLNQLPGLERTGDILIHTRTNHIKKLAVHVSKIESCNQEHAQTALIICDASEEGSTQHLRSSFLANISHEFRTPLSAINASVEYLLEEVEPLSKAEIKELLASIHISVTGLQTLIDNLLESINIEAGRFNIRLQSTDIQEVVTEAGHIMQPLLNRRNQSLCIHQPEQLPMIEADPLRLTQVLVNLLSNASKYGPIGQTIEIDLEVIGDRLLRVAVADQGPGIPERDREKLFQRFARLNHQDGAQYGVGLGLSVVKAIVEEHRGEAGMDARPGGGSVFWFSIPIAGEKR